MLFGLKRRKATATSLCTPACAGDRFSVLLMQGSTHPTKSAAFNSVTLCGARLQIAPAIAEMTEERKNEEERFSDALYRLVWVMLDGDERFIPLHISKKDLPQSAKYVELDKNADSRGEETSDAKKST